MLIKLPGILSVFVFSLASAQIDSLEREYAKPQPDSTYFQLIDRLFQHYQSHDFDRSMQLALDKLKRAKESSNQSQLADGYNKEGIAYQLQGKNKKSIESLEKSIEIRKNIKDTFGLANCYGNLGNIYKQLGDNPKTLEYYELSKSQFALLNVKWGVGFVQVNMGSIYMSMGEYDIALKTLLEALKVLEEINNPQGVSMALNNIAAIYQEQEQYENALKYHRKGLALRIKHNRKKEVALSYKNMGDIFNSMQQKDSAKHYFEMARNIAEKLGDPEVLDGVYVFLSQTAMEEKDTTKAMGYLEKALKIGLETGNKTTQGIAYFQLGSLHRKIGDLPTAKKYLLKSLEIASAAQLAKGISSTLEELSLTYSMLGEYANAYEYHVRLKKHEDSVFNILKQEQLAEMQTKYESEKKDQQLKLQQSEIEKQQEEAKRQNIQKIGFASGFALMLLLAIVTLRSYRRKKKDNEIIQRQKEIVEHQNIIVEGKNKEITDSITYAKRIQQAILPTDNLVRKLLPESFIFYKPKDIVAGDFYWIEPTKSKVILAAADCTGHGVPGAMVSVVCNNALNRSVREFGLEEPAKILNKTRELVIETFEASEQEVKDGMDIALCALSADMKTMEYAGANNNLLILRKGIQSIEEIEEVKADKQPIGLYADYRPFTNHTIQLNAGDVFYIFSDGYVDQFGGKNGKKLKSKPFKEILLSIQNKPLQQQQQDLADYFENWKKDLEQIDDVCVIGVRI